MEFSEYYVAYFDVLGYKEKFKKSEDISKKLVEGIESSIKTTKDLVSIFNDPSLESIAEMAKIEYKVFSDNVLICRKKREYSLSEIDLVYFLRLIATIQRVFCEGSRLVVRGGITKGPLYLTNDLVAGKALIDVVELENNAVYPRIVVDNCILNDLKPKIQHEFLNKFVETFYQDLLIKDTDGKSFLNYIIVYDAWVPFPKEGSQSESVESFEELLKLNKECRLRIPTYNPKCLKEVFVILKKHKDFVEKNINDFSQSSNDATKEASRLKTLKKYLWLASFHNKICQEMYKKSEFKIHLKSEFNEQTLAFDVSVG